MASSGVIRTGMRARCSARPLATPPLHLTKAQVSLRYQRRSLQDVAITRTGKPIIRVAGGRQSLGVFGASGFLGRYIVNRLARSGNTVVIPYREEMGKRHLKVAGDLGRVVFMEWDLRNTQSIEESVRHSDIVFNLVGREYETKNFTYDDVHVEGASRIAEAVAKYDVDRFIHVSSYNADANSPSKFFRTKAEGEKVVRDIFPETTIVRPAPLFGWEDKMLNRFANKRTVLASNGLQERSWPAHAIDVGAALELMAYDDTTAGHTYELYGPNEYRMAEIADICAKEVLQSHRVLNIPKVVRKPLMNFLSRIIWFIETNGDKVEREFLDQVIDAKAKTFRDLGISPVDLKSVTFEYLQGYRSASTYDLPPQTEREKREASKYLHAIDD